MLKIATIRYRGSHQWHAQVRRRGYPTQTKTLNSRAEAEAWARLIESEIDRGIFTPRTEGERTTLAEALKRYEREVSRAKKGAKQEAARIKYWVTHPLGGRPLASIRSSELAKWRDDELARDIAPNTVNKHFILLSHLFNVARREWGMEALQNPVTNVRRPKLPRGRDRRLVADEESRLLRAAKEVHAQFDKLILFALETGMRQGEIGAMERDKIDYERRFVKVEGKNGEARDVPLSSRALDLLQCLPVQKNGRIWAWSGPSIAHMFIECRQRARVAYEAECGKEAQVTGRLVDLTFHDLRHEATSRFFELGLNPMEVAAITGHKTLQMLKRYTHLRAEDLARKLG